MAQSELVLAPLGYSGVLVSSYALRNGLSHGFETAGTACERL